LSKKRAPETVRKVHRVLSLVLAMAAKDGRFVRNVATAVNLPCVVESERQYLTHAEVARLARACARCGRVVVSRHRRLSERYRDDYRLIVLLLAYTRMRFGELAALRVDRLGFDRRAPVFRAAAFDAVATEIGRPALHPHELRHTALDQYGHLFGDRLDEVADRMAAAREATVAQVLPKAEITDLQQVRQPPGTPRKQVVRLVPPAGLPKDGNGQVVHGLTGRLMVEKSYSLLPTTSG
jgi:integrase